MARREHPRARAARRGPLAPEPSHRRKRTAIDAQAAARSERAAEGQRAADGRGERRAHEGRERADGGRAGDKGGSARRTRVPYAEHGIPYRVRNGRLNTAQHARMTGPKRGRGTQADHAGGRAGAERQGVAARGPQGSARGAHGAAPRNARRGGSDGGQKAVLQSPPMGGSARLLGPAVATRPRWVGPAVAAAVVAVLAFAALKLPLCSPQPEATDPGADTAVEATPTRSNILEERLATYAPYESPSPTDLSAIPATSDVSGFSLVDAGEPGSPALSEQSREAIDEALEPFDSNGFDVGFLLMDIGTGRGFACNLDEPIYGASSFKGPYCAYVAESYVDGGQLALSELSDDFFNIIVYSDNDTYDAMRARLPDSKLVLWLDSIGVDSDVAYDTWYPHYTARDSAKLWLATYNYLKGESAAAEVLERNFGRTDTSFMRTAMVEVEEAANAPADDGAADAQATFGGAVSAVLADAIEEARTLEVAVYDKAGWYPRDQDDVPAMVDAGIVECNGRDYLLCVLTNMPWSEPNQADAEALIAAVFEARADLG